MPSTATANDQHADTMSLLNRFLKFKQDPATLSHEQRYALAQEVRDRAFADYQAGKLDNDTFHKLDVMFRMLPRPAANPQMVAKSLATGLRSGAVGLIEASQAARFASDPVLNQVGTPDSWFPCQRR